MHFVLIGKNMFRSNMILNIKLFSCQNLDFFLQCFGVCCGMFFLWVCVVKTSRKINWNLTPSNAYGLPHRSQAFIFETPISKGVNRESSTDNHTGTKKTGLSWGRIWLEIVQIDFQKKYQQKRKLHEWIVWQPFGFASKRKTIDLYPVWI